MYRKIFFITIIIFTFTICANSQSDGFGAGIMVGEPTGISLKSWLSHSTAWDAGVAWQLRRKGRFHFHIDYLLHKFGVFNVRKGELPLYFGVGGRLVASDDPNLGIRGVVGVDYMFEKVPVDIFLEIVPVLELLPGTELDLNGALGARYFF